MPSDTPNYLKAGYTDFAKLAPMAIGWSNTTIRSRSIHGIHLGFNAVLFKWAQSFLHSG